MMELIKDSTRLQLPLGRRFPAARTRRGNRPLGRRAPSVHPPATRRTWHMLEAGDYANVRAVAYDVVLNGYELGGGSIRIHEKELQAKMFEVLGVGPGRTADQVRPPARRLPLRRAAARRPRARPRPHRHAHRRRGQHPRSDRLPEKQPRRGPDDPFAGGGRLQATARSLHPEHGEEGVTVPRSALFKITPQPPPCRRINPFKPFDVGGGCV